MDPYRTVFYNQVDQLPTLDVDTIARCNERYYERPLKPITLSNNRVDTIRLAAILAYGTDEQWGAACRAATSRIVEPGKRKNAIRTLGNDCAGALFYWIRELAPARLYTAQTAERFHTLSEHDELLRFRNFDWIQLLFQARFHEAALIMPSVMLGLGFREDVLLAARELCIDFRNRFLLKQLAYSTNDAELHAVICPGEEMTLHIHAKMTTHEEQDDGRYMPAYAPSLYDQWALVRTDYLCWEAQNFKYYTQTLAELKEFILQTPNFTVEQLRKFEKVVDVSPELPGDFFNQVCAAKYLSVLLGVEEGYYRVSQEPVKEAIALGRVCAIAARLPTDLQHVLALRMAGSMRDVLPQRLADRAYFELEVSVEFQADEIQ